MRVLIVNNMSPFIWGGAEELAVNLQKHLVIAGHEVEVLRIPFQWEPATKIPSQMMMVRAFELWNVDRVIALKFPAYLIRHPNKTLWLLHQYRQAYDLFDAGQTNLPAGRMGDDLRALIKTADNESFYESRNIFTISETTRQRLAKYNGIGSSVLLPPINDSELFVGGETGDYIFAGGRINDMKRQYLLLDALNQTSANVKLIIGGPPDTPADGERLKEAVARFGLEDRCRLDLRFLPREVYAGYIRNAAAVAYLPYDEDYFGYVAVEAAMAGKALITTTDSGGVLGLVKHEMTGWVAKPDRTSLAKAMNSVWENMGHTSELGRAATNLWLSYEANWENTVKTLLQ